MDGNQNQTNNVGSIYCTHCGTYNKSTSKYCMNCGAAINADNSAPLVNAPQSQPAVSTPQETQQQTNNVPQAPQKEKNPYAWVMILLGIASIILAVFVEQAIAVIAIASIASLFHKTTRPYGLTVLGVFAAIWVIGFILMIILFGMCFAGLGGL